MFLARVIKRSKWVPKDGLAEGEIPADAVTAHLRTLDNKISLWRSNTDSCSDVKETALAIAAGRHAVDKLEIVLLDYDDLQTDGQHLIDVDGRTPVEDLKTLHVDVSKLDLIRLGKIATRVADALEAGRYRSFTRLQVKELVADAVERDRIRLGDLERKLRTAVCSFIQQRS